MHADLQGYYPLLQL
uniref:Uncharacterized protein n=1 Tax=Anguilla anguilla TaxID=7936 RepID=A0A0E9SVK1_ANGAN